MFFNYQFIMQLNVRLKIITIFDLIELRTRFYALIDWKTFFLFINRCVIFNVEDFVFIFVMEKVIEIYRKLFFKNKNLKLFILHDISFRNRNKN